MMESMPYSRFMLEVGSQGTLLVKVQMGTKWDQKVHAVWSLRRIQQTSLWMPETLDRGYIYCGPFLIHMYLLWLILIVKVRGSRFT